MPRVLIAPLDRGHVPPLLLALLLGATVVLVALAIVLGALAIVLAPAAVAQPANEELLLGPMRWLPPDGAA